MRELWDEGATAELRITVDGAAADTQMAVEVTGPDGATRAVNASPNAGRTEWIARVEVDQPGIWWAVATATGSGAGVKRYRLRVRPVAAHHEVGRVHATTADLARRLDDAPPLDADRLLARASEVVEELTATAWYRTGPDGYPTDVAIREAMRDATAAQAAYMAEAAAGSEAGDGYTQVSIGSVTLARPQAAAEASSVTLADGTTVAPACMAALRRAGLLPGWPLVVG